MGRRKLTAEERHAKQKERLERSKSIKTVASENTYVAPPYWKQTVSDELTNAGYPNVLIDGVIMFPENDDNRIKEITDFMMSKYGRTEQIKNPYYDGSDNSKEFKEVTRIPFSYGFNKQICLGKIGQGMSWQSKAQILNEESQNIESEYEDDVEEIEYEG